MRHSIEHSFEDRGASRQEEIIRRCEPNKRVSAALRRVGVTILRFHRNVAIAAENTHI